MFPIICQIGPATIYSYGLMLALGVLLCSFLLTRDAKAFNINRDSLFDLIFWVVISGIIGARFFYILLNGEYFLRNPLEIIMVNKGGLAWQGSLIGGIVSGIIFIKRIKWDIGSILDLTAPYVALGQSIGRIGCFLNGCCFGHESSWGIFFPLHAAKLYPTQLFSSVGLLFIYFFLRFYRKFSQKGDVFLAYLLLASALRFFIDFFRADHFNLFWGLSIFQIICVVIFTTALLIRLYQTVFFRSKV